MGRLKIAVKPKTSPTRPQVNYKRISDRENRVAVSCRRFGISVSSTDVVQGLSYAHYSGCSWKDELNLDES
jgi:hypothetical protein